MTADEELLANTLVVRHLKLPRFVHFRYFRGIVDRNSEDYHDLLGEMFLELVRCSRRFNDSKNIRFVTYAIRHLRWVGLDFVYHRDSFWFGTLWQLFADRKRLVRWLERHQPLTPVEADLDELPGTSPDPSRNLSLVELKEAVRRAIDQYPLSRTGRDRRGILRDRYLSGMTLGEIATRHRRHVEIVRQILMDAERYWRTRSGRSQILTEDMCNE